jgi:hypothetical protein
MTNEPNDGTLDYRAALPPGGAAARVPDACFHGGITGQIAAGRYVLQIGEPSGARVGEATRREHSHLRPRPTPVLLYPRIIRSLVGRWTEMAEVARALDAGVPIELSGDPGIGKTAVLRHLAHHPRAASFDDGVVYLSARHQCSADLVQLISDAFCESDEIRKPTDTDVRCSLLEKRALILLDDVRLPPHELEQVLDIAPRSAFVVATRERCSVREVRSVDLKGLTAEDGVSLLEREIERPLDVAEQAAAATVCSVLAGHPFRILQAAALVREQGMSLDACARAITQGRFMTELMAPIDEKQRRALLALSALPGVPLSAQHVSGIAEVTDVEPALTMLARRGIVVSSQSRFVPASGVVDHLRRTEDLRPWVNRAVTYFNAWAERYRRDPVVLLEESEALLRVQQSAADNRRWGEVLRIGSILEGALVIGSRWGAWAIDLARCLAAAKAIGDRSAEGWALHEIGTRHLCVGQADAARASLSQALKVREAMSDTAAAAATRHNLEFVPAPVAVSPRARTRAATPDNRLEVDSLRLRDAREPAPRPVTKRGSTVAIILLTIVLLGEFAYWASAARPTWMPVNVAAIGSLLQRGLDAARAGASPAPQPSQDVAVAAPQASDVREPDAIRAESDVPAGVSPLLASSAPPDGELDRASILIFSPRPSSIVSKAPTNLCYALSGAVDARVEPGIGDVEPASTLTCLRVSPARTTTYQLLAHGRDGYPVRQQLVIVVR